MQQCHLVTQTHNSRALGVDARPPQPSSTGQRLVGLLHLTASHTRPQKLCAELEKHSKTHNSLFIIHNNTVEVFTPKK